MRVVFVAAALGVGVIAVIAFSYGNQDRSFFLLLVAIVFLVWVFPAAAVRRTWYRRAAWIWCAVVAVGSVFVFPFTYGPLILLSVAGLFDRPDPRFTHRVLGATTVLLGLAVCLYALVVTPDPPSPLRVCFDTAGRTDAAFEAASTPGGSHLPGVAEIAVTGEAEVTVSFDAWASPSEVRQIESNEQQIGARSVTRSSC